jgi:hypothetical protein
MPNIRSGDGVTQRHWQSLGCITRSPASTTTKRIYSPWWREGLKRISREEGRKDSAHRRDPSIDLLCHRETRRKCPRRGSRNRPRIEKKDSHVGAAVAKKSRVRRQVLMNTTVAGAVKVREARKYASTTPIFIVSCWVVSH